MSWSAWPFPGRAAAGAVRREDFFSIVDIGPSLSIAQKADGRPRRRAVSPSAADRVRRVDVRQVDPAGERPELGKG